MVCHLQFTSNCITSLDFWICRCCLPFYTHTCPDRQVVALKCQLHEASPKILMNLTKLEKFVQKYKVKRALHDRSLFACFRMLQRTYLFAYHQGQEYVSKLLKIGIIFNKYDLRPSKVFRSGNTYSTSVIILVQLSYCFNQQHFKRLGV